VIVKSVVIGPDTSRSSSKCHVAAKHPVKKNEHWTNSPTLALEW